MKSAIARVCLGIIFVVLATLVSPRRSFSQIHHDTPRFNMDSECKAPGVTCKTFLSPATFEFKSVGYAIGFIEENKKLPPTASHPILTGGGGRIRTLVPKDIDDVPSDTYSLYRLCYGKAPEGQGALNCSKLIDPQPNIGQLHPEVFDPTRTPYDLLIANVEKNSQYDPQFLTVTLKLQENRELTINEKDRILQHRETLVSQTASIYSSDFYGPPIYDFSLQYEFAVHSKNILFKATEATKDLIENLNNRIVRDPFEILGVASNRPILKECIPDYSIQMKSPQAPVSGGPERLYFNIAGSGKVEDNVRVIKSSGNSERDELDVNALKQWQFAAMNSEHYNERQWGIIRFDPSDASLRLPENPASTSR